MQRICCLESTYISIPWGWTHRTEVETHPVWNKSSLLARTPLCSAPGSVPPPCLRSPPHLHSIFFLTLFIILSISHSTSCFLSPLLQLLSASVCPCNASFPGRHPYTPQAETAVRWNRTEMLKTHRVQFYFRDFKKATICTLKFQNNK